MRVLGIDPGTHVTGWGIVGRRGTTLTAIAHGAVRADKSLPLEARLLAIHAGLARAIADHAPDAAAVEDAFHGRYPGAALTLGHARGVALLAAAEAGLSVVSLPPALVKRAVTGHGRADKGHVARVVGAALGLRPAPTGDAADALAIAITALQASPALRRA